MPTTQGRQAKNWTPEGRLLAADGLVTDAHLSHMLQLTREAPYTKGNALKALKLLEAAGQIIGRDIARDLSIPPSRRASASPSRVAQRHLAPPEDL